MADDDDNMADDGSDNSSDNSSDDELSMADDDDDDDERVKYFRALISTAVGLDKHLLIELCLAHKRNEISNFELKDAFDKYAYCTKEDEDNLDNWFPSEKDVKTEEEEEVKYNKLLDELMGSLEETERVISKRRKRHGAVAKRKICSDPNCTNIAVKGGVCVKHGAQVKRCSDPSCTNNARVGGVCRKHGAAAARKRKKTATKKTATNKRKR